MLSLGPGLLSVALVAACGTQTGSELSLDAERPGSAAVSCAAGGGAANTCVVGDTGPGGGAVFYVNESNPTGSRYLEAAPPTWANRGSDPAAAWWGCPDTSPPSTTGTAIGAGKGNTTAIVAGCPTAKNAARLAHDYSGGGQTDWFLPSKDELNALDVSGVGDLPAWTSVYWSSSLYGMDLVWVQLPGWGGGTRDQSRTDEDNTNLVRPVRAF